MLKDLISYEYEWLISQNWGFLIYFVNASSMLGAPTS